MVDGTNPGAESASSQLPDGSEGSAGGVTGEPALPDAYAIAMTGDPCQAALAIVSAAMQAVSAADGCRLCLVRRPEFAPLVEVCTRGGVATPLDTEHAMPVLQQTLVQGKVVHVDDLRGASALEAACVLEGPARSLLLAPLSIDAATLGLLALSASRPAAFSPADGERIRGVASQAAAVLHFWARLLRAEQDCRDALAITEGLYDGLVVLDGDGRIVRVNRQLANLVGFDGLELALPCDPDDPNCPAALRTLLQPSGGTIVGPYEVGLDTPAGKRVTLLVSPTPVSSPRLGEMRVVRDVSAERAAVEAQLLFVSQVAHELRGPLQHIMGFTSLIRDIDDLPRDSYERFFGHIKDEADHLARLIDDLVELSRIEMGRFSIHPETTRLDTLVADVIERMRPRSQLRGLSLTLQAPPEPVWARIDPLRITQVLSNLVENALKFVPSGGTIAVTIHPDGNHHVIVSVTDTGPGIPPEALGLLFQRFYQVRSDVSRSLPGMGLGLYTCREIIAAHGGEIWAESEYGAGSTFHFRLERATP